MIPLLIATALSTTITLSLILLPKTPFYFFGPFVGLVTFFPLVIIMWRKIAEKVQPVFEEAQRQAQAGKVDQAVEALQKALEWRHWQFFLEKQVNTQIGSLYYAGGKEKQAVDYLQRGYPKTSEGHLILATILFRENKLDEARDALDLGIRFNRKSPILYNVLAWMLNKKGQRDAAIEVLETGLKKMKSDEETSENLDRLRNNKKMNMKSFGQLWYMLKFETPPGMAVGGAPVRKGFRQPPKQKGRARKR